MSTRSLLTSESFRALSVTSAGRRTARINRENLGASEASGVKGQHTVAGSPEVHGSLSAPGPQLNLSKTSCFSASPSF